MQNAGNTARQGGYLLCIIIGIVIIVQSAGVSGGAASPFGIGFGIGFALLGIYSWVRNLSAVMGRDGNSVTMQILPRSTVDGVVMAVLFFGGPLVGLIVDLAS